MREIILIAPLVDESSYRLIQENNKLSNPGQKFYELLYKGLIMNGYKVSVYSIVNEIYKTNLDNETSIFHQFYSPDSYFSKLKAYNNITKQIKLKEKSNSVIIADAEAYWTLKAAIKSRRLNGNKVVALITDFPHNVYSYSSKRKQNVILDKFKKLYAKQKLRTFRNADGFILLTEQMKNMVAGYKPWIVVEGFSDANLITSLPTYSKAKFKNIVYLGALNGKSGILDLIKAFMNVKKEELRLDIYGSGVLTGKILEYCQKDTRINYCGVVSLNEIVKIEREAHFLINPRPSNQEFNKYSFPSKTIEYMSSGTPVITTKLEGIPDEYNDFLNFIDDFSIDILTKQLIEITDMNEIDLFSKGESAKEFVLSMKNNKIQSKRILEFIEEQIHKS